MATRSAPVIAHCQGRLGLRSDDDAILYSTDRDRTTVRNSLRRRPHMHVASNGWSARLYWLWILYNS
jgi:hypothetical protein